MQSEKLKDAYIQRSILVIFNFCIFSVIFLEKNENNYMQVIYKSKFRNCENADFFNNKTNFKPVLKE